MAQVPEKSNRVFRVRQLPPYIQLHELASLLHRALKCSGPIDHIRVFSLAPSIDSTDQHPTKTATIGFVTIPDSFSNHENEWSFHMLGVSHTIIVDTHFLGFTTLNDVRPENHTVDCFAIPGLASHPFGSWRPHNTSSSFMWLRDSLPKYLPTARIITYGYDTNLVGSQSFQTIEDIAISLIARLRSIGSTLLPAKPTIFLAHSLGGVALKQALVHIANGGKQDVFLSKIKKIMFFGVPNRGMKVAHLLPMVQDQPNEALVHLLSEDSSYLSLLDEQFNGISFVRRMHLVSVYETQRTQTPLEVEPGRWKRDGPFEVLVARESVIHRFSDESDIYPVNKNHSDLVKFSEDESDLKTILDFLRSVNRICPGPSCSSHPQTGPYTGTVNDASAESLSPIGKTYNSCYEERSEYREQVFRRGGVGLIEWLENDRGLFWINGKPGSGKSTVMKHICNNLYRNDGRRILQQDKTAISRYCNNNEVCVDEEDLVGKTARRRADVMREFRIVQQDKAAISRYCNNNEVCVDEEDLVGKTARRRADVMRELNEDDSAEVDCRDTSSTETSESMENWSGVEGGVHSEPPGETNAYFFFSHRGSEIQKSFEGLLRCVLYEVFSRGVAERQAIGALRTRLRRDIPDAEAALVAQKKDMPRLEREYHEARCLSREECESQGRNWCERDERIATRKRKKAQRSMEDEFDVATDGSEDARQGELPIAREQRLKGNAKLKEEARQAELVGAREERLKDREDAIREQICQAEEGIAIQENHIGKLLDQYDTTVKEIQNPRIWRHENAHLLHELLLRRLALPPDKMTEWPVADLEMTLLRILTQLQVQIKITLFLDALDEYAGNPKKIVKFLEHAVRQTKHSLTRLKICFTSRPWDIFKDHFANQPGFSMQNHTSSDIDNYAKARLHRHIATHTMSEEVGQSLRLRVLERAEGVFLWVRLVLDTILVELVHGASPSELHLLLAAFPDGLEDLYIATLVRVESRYRKECYVMLEVVLRSEHPMKFDHFYEAVQHARSFYDKSSTEEQSSILRGRECRDDIRLYDMVSRRIKSRCGGLLEIRNGVVQLMHQTVQDFLLLPGTMRLLVEPGEKLSILNGHSFLARGLAHELCQPGQHEPLELMHSCMYHANQAELSTGLSQITTIDSIEDWTSIEHLGIPSRACSPSLTFAVVANLQICVRDLLSQDPMCPRDLGRLLHCAVEFHKIHSYRRGAADLSGMIKLLLDLGADSCYTMHGMTPFQILFQDQRQGAVNGQICDSSSFNIAKVLLKAPGADPNGDIILSTTSSHLPYPPRDGNDVLTKSKPLHVAGGMAMMRLLLEAGAYVNGLNSAGQTPLDVFCSERCEHTDLREIEGSFACERQLRQSGGVRKSSLSTITHTTTVDTLSIEESRSRESLPPSTCELLDSSMARDEEQRYVTDLGSALKAIFCACLPCLLQRRKTPMQGQLSSRGRPKARRMVTPQMRDLSKDRHASHEPSQARRIPKEVEIERPKKMVPVGKPRGGPTGNYLEHRSAGRS